MVVIWVLHVGFASTTLPDWFETLTQLFHSVKSKTKTNRKSLAFVLPFFASAACNYFEFWLVLSVLSLSFVIVQNDNCSLSLVLGFYNLNWKPLYWPG